MDDSMEGRKRFESDIWNNRQRRAGSILNPTSGMIVAAAGRERYRRAVMTVTTLTLTLCFEFDSSMRLNCWSHNLITN